MKPTKAKPESEPKKSPKENNLSLFIVCARCNRPYEDIKNLPLKCVCGACLLCEN